MMHFTLCFLSIWLFIFSAGGNAAIHIPETVVRISIIDLLPKKERKAEATRYKLPADFGDRVAKLILASEEPLSNCASELKTAQAHLSLELKILPDGSGKVIFPKNSDESEINECVKGIIEKIGFPSHKLSQPAFVELPLILERKVL